MIVGWSKPTANFTGNTAVLQGKDTVVSRRKKCDVLSAKLVGLQARNNK